MQFSSWKVPVALSLLPLGLISANATPAGQESIPQLGYAYLAWSKVDNAFQPIPGTQASCSENNPNYIDSTTVSAIPVAAKADF